MKIPSLVYIILGGAISFFSSFVNQRTENNGIILFFYIGIGFIIYGVFKLILKFVLKDKEEPIKQEKPKVVQDKTIIRCHVCGAKHYSNSNFCHLCGTKLLK
ncbi:MAG: hypothetical protein ACMXX9_00375 [Candidatus Woesearchaeota archaeon]